MTDGEAMAIEPGRGRDPVRRVVLGLLTLYLAPVALVVLLIGASGLACCAVLRLAAGGHRCDDRAWRDRPARAVVGPHARPVARVGSSRL